MRRPRDIALHVGFYITAALSGIAAAYVLNEWLRHWWDARHPPRVFDDEPKSAPPSPPQQDKPLADTSADAASVSDPEHADPNNDARMPSTSQTRSLPPLHTYPLPPPLPNGRVLLTSSSSGVDPKVMTSSMTLHTSSDHDGVEDDSASQTTTSDTDTEPFVDILSPPPTHVISRRRSLRNHDLFATSHISFSELGNLVAPENEIESDIDNVA